MIPTDEQIVEIAKTLKSNDLPGILSDIAYFIGVYKALLIAAHMSGNIYLMRWSANPEAWSQELKMLVAIVGATDAAVISKYINGGHITIPICIDLWRMARNQAVLEAVGKSRIIDIARKFGISDRHVRRIVRNAKMRACKRQASSTNRSKHAVH